MTGSEIRDAALRWAKAGYRVLPLVPEGKRPLVADPYHVATADLEQVAEWWKREPAANIGIATGDRLVVLDIDRKGEKDGLAALLARGVPHWMVNPETVDLRSYYTRTPTGGMHLWFRKSPKLRLVSKADVLGPGSGVDIRAEGAHVVVAPSVVVGGKRYVAHVAPGDPHGAPPRLAMLPAWEEVANYIPEAKPKPPAPPPPPPPSGEARPDVLERAAAYLATMDPAISGQGGHNATLRATSALLWGFQLPEGDVLHLLATDYNPRCSPPWSEQELRHKVESATKIGPPPGKAPGWLLDAEREVPAAKAPPPRVEAPSCAPPTPTPPASPPPLPAPPAPSPSKENEAVEEAPVEAVAEAAPTGPSPAPPKPTSPAPAKPKRSPPPPKRPKPEVLTDLSFPPGPVGDLARWIYERCAKPYRPFAIFAALAVGAVLVGRKVEFERLHPILYLLLNGPTSGGKNDPLTLAEDILRQVGVSSRHLMGRASSYNALAEREQECWFHAVLLSSVDEAGDFLRETAGTQGVRDFCSCLKELWSRGGSVFHPKKTVNKEGVKGGRDIHRPALSCLWASTPQQLGGALREAQLEDGMLPRFVQATQPRFIIDRDRAALARSRKLTATEEGTALRDKLWQCWNILLPEDAAKGIDALSDLEALPDPGQKPRGRPKKAPPKPEGDSGEDETGGETEKEEAPELTRFEVWADPVSFDADPEADDLFEAFYQRSQRLCAAAAENRAHPRNYLWGKAAENAKRIALVCAAIRCFSAPGTPYRITAEEAGWAIRIVEAAVRETLTWASDNMAESPFERDSNLVLRDIRAAKKGLTRSDLLRRHRKIGRSLLDDLLDTLLDADLIRREGVTAKGARFVATPQE